MGSGLVQLPGHAGALGIHIYEEGDSAGGCLAVYGDRRLGRAYGIFHCIDGIARNLDELTREAEVGSPAEVAPAPDRHSQRPQRVRGAPAAEEFAAGLAQRGKLPAAGGNALFVTGHADGSRQDEKQNDPQAGMEEGSRQGRQSVFEVGDGLRQVTCVPADVSRDKVPVDK